MRLLIVEDEIRIAQLVAEALRQSGFAADAVNCIADADAVLASTVYDAVVLDLGLPDGDGLGLLAALRRKPEAPPVLVLTARDTVEDRVAGLDAGADDYLVKPFAMVELVARVKALLRRPGGPLGLKLEAGNLAFDTVGRDVTVGDLVVPLARQEVAILEHLLRRMGRVVPKAVLEEKLYGMGDELESNAIPVHVHHLRRKLIEANARCVIHTVRGVGYFLEDSP
ncbi:MAG TPA: response regulator [Phenylobacterium sp.]|jgi:DNA-binding response OmpR family regulator|uniref:response regulator n=1 Tax=Phenylobacterium sp. TaxID=1871053 RepID=UPI002D372D5E|nr:response regulator [Phenylobacterium sp.]HZZ68917.1 response regulator [Phenylobacterium sp.]